MGKDGYSALSPLHTDHPAVIVAAVALGGAAGAAGRYALTLAFPVGAVDFPLITMIINIVGALLIGSLTVLVAEKITTLPWVKPLLGTGFLGGFTTFSTAMTDAVARGTQGHWPLGAIYTGATLIGAVFAAVVGVRVTRAVIR